MGFRVLLRWLPFAVLTTAFAFAGYVLVQQSLRTGANDPQVQLAEDAVAALESGTAPAQVVPTGSVDATTSLAPFVVVVGADGNDLATSGQLDGNPPIPPSGVLDYARAHGEDRLTWQPKTGVRLATVVLPFGGADGGWVVGARSLREVEKRESQTLTLAFLAWVAGLVGTLIAVAIGEAASEKRTA